MKNRQVTYRPSPTRYMAISRAISRAKALALVITVISGAALLSCSKPADNTPPPVAMTEQAVGYFCRMSLLEHEGPKAQIHTRGNKQPIWFTQVRDAVAFTRSVEEHDVLLAMYVHDMGQASNWASPGDEAWINAADAWFVIGSKITGGMQTPEVIPFGSSMGAQQFVTKNGGAIVSLDQVPSEYVTAPLPQTHTASPAQWIPIDPRKTSDDSLSQNNQKVAP